MGEWIVSAQTLTPAVSQQAAPMAIGRTYGVGVIAGSGGADTVAGSTTSFYTFGGSATDNTTETAKQLPMPQAGTIKAFYFQGGVQPVGGDLVITVRKNAASTTLTVTCVTNTTCGVIADTTHTFSVVAGDLLSLQVANASVSASANILGFSVVIAP
jgi:hypothetical protein